MNPAAEALGGASAVFLNHFLRNEGPFSTSRLTQRYPISRSYFENPKKRFSRHFPAANKTRSLNPLRARQTPGFCVFRLPKFEQYRRLTLAGAFWRKEIQGGAKRRHTSGGRSGVDSAHEHYSSYITSWQCRLQLITRLQRYRAPHM